MDINEFETDKSQREAAQERPIDGRFPELAHEIRRLLGWVANDGRPFLTSRMASRKTGVNYSTIAALTRGDRAGAETLRKLAEGLNGDVVGLMRAAGYLPEEPSNVVRETRAGYLADTNLHKPENIAMAEYLRSIGQYDNFETDLTDEEIEMLRKATDEVIAGWQAERKRASVKGKTNQRKR